MFRPRTAPEAIKLVEKLLEYTPEARLSAVEAMCHPFFDELRNEDTRLQPQDKPLPRLFDFTREGESSTAHVLFCHTQCITTELSIRPDLVRSLVPPHCEAELRSRGIVLDNFVPIPLEELRITLD